jgi:SMI1 / KNR4 family (SUKH-1)
MSQHNYDDLIARILTHCQQVARDMKPPSFGWKRQGEEWVRVELVGQYVSEHKSFIALKKPFQGQELSFAFPPVREQQLKKTERQLGFSLPPLLRLLYTQIANGGFGPGYGITGAIGGYPFHDISVWGNIARVYHQAVKEAARYRQSCIGDRSLEAAQKGRKATFYIGPDGKLVYEDTLPPLWTEHLLPLCQWGCNISTYIHADTGQIFQGMGGPDLFVAASLEEWLERWLAGESLQFM